MVNSFTREVKSASLSRKLVRLVLAGAVPRGSKRIKCTTRHTNVILSPCGQTLNNDGLLSVWFNDEDCQAHVRDAYFLNW